MSCNSVLFFIYFLSLSLFSLINHPIYYCGLLVVNSMISSGICYLVFGFSWYSLLFCLVYIGGVYILFVFVSVYSPNSSYVVWLSSSFNYLFLLVFILFLVVSLLIYLLVDIEFSGFLCTSCEGSFYVVMCLILLFGFSVLSMIMSVKINYYR